jgi:hypothetical protein
MPTDLSRYSVTETPEIARALDAAATVWPAMSRSQLVRRLIVTGGDVVRNDTARRAAMVTKWAGFLPDAYPADAAEQLKAEWPQ